MKKDDLIEKRMEYYSKVKYPCVICGRKMPIRYDKEFVICSWCKNPVFRTEEEFKRYEFKKKFRKAIK